MQAPFNAFFLTVDGATPGQRFCIYHPARGDTVRGAVVYVHPLAEEMNKSRRMAALQSRALAQAGYAVLQIDLLGCGDSSGDFGDASWQCWVDDVVRGCAWLGERVQAPLWLWGLRVGCLLATDAAKLLAHVPNFLFWAPVASGKQALQQFMRLKTASEIASGNAKGVLDALRADWAQGKAAEISGYWVAPSLAEGLERANLLAPATDASAQRKLLWFEISTRADAVISPIGSKNLALWQVAGFGDAHAQVTQGPSFWQTTEIEDAPALITATVAAMMERSTA